MTEVKHASESDVRGAVGEWSDGVLSCRMYGHRWEPYRATINKRHGFIYVERICKQCWIDKDCPPTIKHEEMSLRGRVYSSWYSYAAGYLTDGMGRIIGDARDALRLGAVSRIYSATIDPQLEARSGAARRDKGN